MGAQYSLCDKRPALFEIEEMNSRGKSSAAEKCQKGEKPTSGEAPGGSRSKIWMP